MIVKKKGCLCIIASTVILIASVVYAISVWAMEHSSHGHGGHVAHDGRWNGVLSVGVVTRRDLCENFAELLTAKSLGEKADFGVMPLLKRRLQLTD